MLDFLRWVMVRREHTKDAARERLQVALMRDRMDVSPDVMDSLKQDVLAAIGRYMVVGDEFHEFEIRRQNDSVLLVSNIRVKEMPRWNGVN